MATGREEEEKREERKRERKGTREEEESKKSIRPHEPPRPIRTSRVEIVPIFTALGIRSNYPNPLPSFFPPRTRLALLLLLSSFSRRPDFCFAFAE